MVLGRGGCSVNRNHTCFKLGSDDPEEVKATFEQTHVAENANSLGAHHVRAEKGETKIIKTGINRCRTRGTPTNPDSTFEIPPA